MPKIQITPELSDALADLRKSHQLTAKELSSLIGKSPSYITVLEKNGIKTLTLSDFESILTNIVGKNPADLDEAYEELQNFIEINYSKEELDQQLWFTNFDLVRRKQPIPDDLVDEFVASMKENSISEKTLLSTINSNLDIPEEEFTLFKSHNEYEIVNNSTSILMDMSEATLQNILHKKAKTTKYVNLFAIAYYLQRLIKNNLNRELDTEAHQTAGNQLKAHKVYTIENKDKLRNEKNEDALPAEDKKNQKLIKQIEYSIRALSDYDIMKTNSLLETIAMNLDADLGLVMSIYGLDFSKIEKMTREKKQEFYDGIKDFINSFEIDNASSITLYND